ncbi:MAG: hypothetical protein ABR970_02560 [Roseiarcus sp.]|jgi:hypothetical protein
MIDAPLSEYALKPLTPDVAGRIYPLIRGVAPALTPEAWRAYATTLTAGPPDAEREEALVAVNPGGYVKGLSIFAVRGHWRYGRLLDAPVFVVASAADSERVGAALIGALQATCAARACAGVRIWTMGPATWDRRLSADDVRRTDHGVFLPALANAAEAEAALAACLFAGPAVIDRPCP